jgi:hypothetical protein
MYSYQTHCLTVIVGSMFRLNVKIMWNVSH